ncbi:MAG: CHRD domain-containing protein [Archangium sp.]|nr:CHRD domain-containing protein [Archangium sp.]
MRPMSCVLLVMAATACGPRELRITMNSDNNSGQTGFAVVTDHGNKGLTIVIETSAPDFEGSQAVHVHNGTCGEVGPLRAPLLNLEVTGQQPGRTGSTSPEVRKTDGSLLTLAELSKGEWLINVHDARDFGIYVSCGEIPHP